MHRTNETGRTLLEMFVVMTLLAVITIGVVQGLQHAIGVYRASVVTTEVDEIAKQTLRLTSFYSNFAQANMTILCDNDILPRACVAGAWPAGWSGGTIAVAPVDNDASFTITITNIPDLICGRMKVYGWQNVYIEDPSCGAMVFEPTLSYGGAAEVRP
ncbi:MAG: type 4 pilus major pilin [Alphaproteobacteria bacterium]|nr:type 4 pilus major pilin [Alphaproteobacteria bacterium]